MTHDYVQRLDDIARHDLTASVKCLLQRIETRLSNELDSNLERAITTLAGQRHLQLNLGQQPTTPSSSIYL